MKLKFLFISRDTFPPFRVDVNILFGKEISSRGHSIDWILQSNDHCDLSYQTLWSGCRIWVGRTDIGVTRFRRVKKYIYSILHDLKIFNLLRKHQYDFIQVKDKFISALLAILASKIHGLHFFYWLSYPFPEADLYKVKTHTARYLLFYYIRGKITKFLLYKIIMPNADHIFVQSEQMKKDISLMGIPEEKMTPVPMGVSLNDIPYKNNLPKMNSDNKIILYLGTLEKIRKIDFLIRVFGKVIQEIPQAKLYIVGGGNDQEDEEILKNEALRIGIQKSIFFLGFLPMREAWSYLSKANVCVSPFYPTPILNSTSPTKLIEYMAMGKPVVANDHPEQRLIITESGGGLCVPYDLEAFAEAIVDLLKNPQKAKNMGDKGRVYVKKYRTYQTIANIVECEYLRFFSSVGESS